MCDCRRNCNICFASRSNEFACTSIKSQDRYSYFIERMAALCNDDFSPLMGILDVRNDVYRLNFTACNALVHIHKWANAGLICMCPGLLCSNCILRHRRGQYNNIVFWEIIVGGMLCSKQTHDYVSMAEIDLLNWLCTMWWLFEMKKNNHEKNAATLTGGSDKNNELNDLNKCKQLHRTIRICLILLTNWIQLTQSWIEAMRCEPKNIGSNRTFDLLLLQMAWEPVQFSFSQPIYQSFLILRRQF